jgi:hypothetical protein
MSREPVAKNGFWGAIDPRGDFNVIDLESPTALTDVLRKTFCPLRQAE